MVPSFNPYESQTVKSLIHALIVQGYKSRHVPGPGTLLPGLQALFQITFYHDLTLGSSQTRYYVSAPSSRVRTSSPSPSQGATRSQLAVHESEPPEELSAKEHPQTEDESKPAAVLTSFSDEAVVPSILSHPDNYKSFQNLLRHITDSLAILVETAQESSHKFLDILCASIPGCSSTKPSKAYLTNNCIRTSNL